MGFGDYREISKTLARFQNWARTVHLIEMDQHRQMGSVLER